jgi:hypothetical protein
MKRFAAGALALVAVAAILPHATAEESAQRAVPINVRIQCNGEAIGEVEINPYTATLSRASNDVARFQLVGGSDVSSAQVRPKEGQAWPFQGEPPTFGQGRNATTQSIRADIANGRYGYDLIVTCGSEPDVVDPNMDIDP